MNQPFSKPFPAKDNWSQGRNQKSWQYDTEFVIPFNRNSADRSPTTSSKEFKDIDKNKFLKKPFKG